MRHIAAALLHWVAQQIDPPKPRVAFGDIRMAQQRYILAQSDLVKATRERAGTYRQYADDV